MNSRNRCLWFSGEEMPPARDVLPRDGDRGIARVYWGVPTGTRGILELGAPSEWSPLKPCQGWSCAPCPPLLGHRTETAGAELLHTGNLSRDLSLRPQQPLPGS